MAMLSIFSGLLLVVYVFSYVYLLFNDRDALRSERFTLSKMAIERSITGDSLRGFVEGDVLTDRILKTPVQPTSGQGQE